MLVTQVPFELKANQKRENRVNTEPEMDKVPEEYYAEDATSGWALFAAMMLFGVSMFAFMAMCTGWLVPNYLQYSALGTTIDWIWYGVFDGLTGLVALGAGSAIMQGRKAGYWLGLIIATLSAGRWFLFIPAVPFWGLTMVVVWILVIYGLIRSRKSFT